MSGNDTSDGWAEHFKKLDEKKNRKRDYAEEAANIREAVHDTAGHFRERLKTLAGDSRFSYLFHDAVGAQELIGELFHPIDIADFSNTEARKLLGDKCPDTIKDRHRVQRMSLLDDYAEERDTQEQRYKLTP